MTLTWPTRDLNKLKFEVAILINSHVHEKIRIEKSSHDHSAKTWASQKSQKIVNCGLELTKIVQNFRNREIPCQNQGLSSKKSEKNTSNTY